MKKIALLAIVFLLIGALGILFSGIGDLSDASSNESSQNNSSTPIPPVKPSDEQDSQPDSSTPIPPVKPSDEQDSQPDFSKLTAAFIGDSITVGLCKGVVMDTPYPAGVAATLNLKSVTNLGIGGSTLCTKNYNSMVSRYATVPEGTNIIGVHGGVNDWAQNFTLGDITSTETRTIYGALDYLARNLKAKYPDAFIFFMTPTPVSDAKLEQYSATPYSLGDVAQAMKDVAEKYGFAVLDLYAVSGFESVCNDTNKTDGVHPYQEYVTDTLVPIIADFIKSSFNSKNDKGNSENEGSSPSKSETTDKSKTSLKGKNISILGDSISTWNEISNDSVNTNSTISNNEARYPQTDLGLTAFDETWWHQVITHYEANLLVNNSWRGTRVERSEASSAFYRCEQLHDDTGENSGTNPDVIFVYMGINDLGKIKTCGNFVSAEALKENGEYINPKDSNFAESYAIMVDKIVSKYPEADVFLFTLPHSTYNQNYSNDKLREQYNQQIRKIAETYSLGIVDLAILPEYNNVDNYTNDGLHPNVQGMNIIAIECIQALNRYYYY